jgi:hypothetical protein
MENLIHLVTLVSVPAGFLAICGAIMFSVLEN